MSYKLNKKRLIKTLYIIFAFLLVILIVLFMFFNDSTIEKIKITGMLMTYGIPIFIFVTGVIGISLTAYLNIRTLIYQNSLTVTNDSIVYDSYVNKKVKINKEDIEKIYVLLHNDDYLIKNKYVAITTKNPIQYSEKRSTFLSSLLRKESNDRHLYINVSELDEDPEKIAFEIESKLAISIKKKGKEKYFNDKF